MPELGRFIDEMMKQTKNSIDRMPELGRFIDEMMKQTNKSQKGPYLDQKLEEYAGTDYYPFHMPGHKRRAIHFSNPYGIDITEIDGFDNLHHAEGILFQAQERLRELYKSKKAYYLINGSTSGILSAVAALVKPREEVLIARNCHKSVYNAAKIFGLKVHFVYPQFLECGIQGKIDTDQVEHCLREFPAVKLVVITSPTYEGIVSDISIIADLAVKYNSYLIVDEAHGAHFSLSSYFPESAVRQNADIVIQSLHKTLPSFTQTAVLHIASERVDCRKVEEALGIFQTSSPSYVLMAGIERCVRLLEQSGRQLFEQYYERLCGLYQKCKQLKFLHVFSAEDYAAYGAYVADPSKIVISSFYTAIDGYTLYQILLEKYHLQMELYSAQYVLAMTSIMDTQEGFERLVNALTEIDMDLAVEAQYDVCQKQKNEDLFLKRAYAVRKKAMDISEISFSIEEKELEETELKNSAGRICAEFVYLYPPGVPMIIPGEVITDEFIEVLEECRRRGLNVQGTKDRQYRKILTVAH